MDRFFPLALALNFLLILSLFSAGACSRRSGVPRLSVGIVNGMAENDPEIPRILESLKKLIVLLEKDRFAGLPAMVSAEKGLYVDLKSHRKKEELAGEIADPASYLSRYYLDTEGLRAETGDDTQLAVRDLLRGAGEIKVDFFREGDDECELKLHIVDDEEGSFRLNNPVFIREKGEWLVYRLF